MVDRAVMNGIRPRYGLGRVEGRIGSQSTVSIYNQTRMDLDLTEAQREFREGIAQSARDKIAAEAAGIDERGESPRTLVAEMAALGLLGVTTPAESGGA